MRIGAPPQQWGFFIKIGQCQVTCTGVCWTPIAELLAFKDWEPQAKKRKKYGKFATTPILAPTRTLRRQVLCRRPLSPTRPPLACGFGREGGGEEMAPLGPDTRQGGHAHRQPQGWQKLAGTGLLLLLALRGASAQTTAAPQVVSVGFFEVGQPHRTFFFFFFFFPSLHCGFCCCVALVRRRG